MIEHRRFLLEGMSTDEGKGKYDNIMFNRITANDRGHIDKPNSPYTSCCV